MILCKRSTSFSRNVTLSYYKRQIVIQKAGIFSIDALLVYVMTHPWISADFWNFWRKWNLTNWWFQVVSVNRKPVYRLISFSKPKLLFLIAVADVSFRKINFYIGGSNTPLNNLVYSKRHFLFFISEPFHDICAIHLNP